MKNIDPRNPEQFLGALDSVAYNAGYDLNLNDPYHIVLEASNESDPMPIIHADYEHDSKYFWYTVHMEFPDRLDEGEYSGHFHHILEKWAKAGEIADYLMTHQWRFDDTYED